MRHHPLQAPPFRSIRGIRATRIVVLATLGLTGIADPARAQTLVRDFTPTTIGRSGSPSAIVTAGSLAYFTANSEHGIELWRSDGTGSGTFCLKDLNPGAAPSFPEELTAVGTRLFFTADVPGYGRELFVTDGTTAGTVLVRDINALPDLGSAPQYLTAFQGRVFFTANDGVVGPELWTSDGTAAGTTLVIDLMPGTVHSAPSDYVVWNGRLWFVAQDSRGRELWSTDGTAAGTQILVDFVPGSGSALPEGLIATVGNVFFTASENATGREIYATDGTPAGTRRVADIQPGQSGSNPSLLTAFGALVVFRANDPVGGQEPWRSDGTQAGTFALGNLNPGTAPSQPDEFTVAPAGNRLFFAANDGGPRTLFATDGTVAGTAVVLPGLQNVAHLAPAFGGVAFAANTATTNGMLWQSNGTAGGTAPVIGSPLPSFTRPFAGGVLFSASNNLVGRELFASNGTSAGTMLVRDLYPDLMSSPLGLLTELRGSLFFAPTFPTGWVPWLSDGTAAGTSEITLGLNNPSQPVRWRGDVWFVASAPATSFELCVSNGSPLGTGVAFDLVPGTGTPSIQSLVPTSGPLFFTASTGAGRELFATDGTLAGTRQFDLAPGAASGNPQAMAAFGNRCLFSVDAGGGTGREPWVSDGTVAGTWSLGDLAPVGGSLPEEFTFVAGRAFFVATLPGVGRELCVTDGTPGGTGLFADLLAGTLSSSPHELVAGDTLLYFQASTAAGIRLWVSDGTIAGTGVLRDITPSLANVQVQDMVTAGDRLFFFADDSVHGRELWTSDGTTAGTLLVADLMPGNGHGPVAGTLTRVPGTNEVVFAAGDPIDGLQLWRSDGTAAGTRRLGQMGSRPGAGASILALLTPVGDRLFFHAGIDDGAGQELWVVPLQGGSAPAVAVYGDSLCPGTGGLVPRIGAAGLPQLGNAAFAIDVTQARPLSFATLQLGFGRANVALGACRVLVLPPLASMPLVATTLHGTARTPVPVPGNPNLLGLRVNGQYAVFDANGALLGGFALSDGIEFRIGS
jgi:ELWxxDGT repeat protein